MSGRCCCFRTIQNQIPYKIPRCENNSVCVQSDDFLHFPKSMLYCTYIKGWINKSTLIQTKSGTKLNVDKKNSPFLYILVMFTIGFMWSGIWLLWFISFHTWTKIVFCLTFLGVNKFHFFFQLYFSIFFSKFPFFSLYILLFEKNICNKIDFRSDIVSFPRHFTCFFVWFSPSLIWKRFILFLQFYINLFYYKWNLLRIFEWFSCDSSQAPTSISCK